MKLIDMKQQGFIDLLASAAPAPGGGSVAALEGALGAALLHMVAALTAGKEKYAASKAAMQTAMTQTEELYRQLTDIVDRDSQAFDAVTAVFAMPKDTPEQRTARSEAMQRALMACTLTPYEVMELSLAALKAADEVLTAGYNTNAASDLGVAALSLSAAVRGAWLNVLINVGGIQDVAFARQYRDKGRHILDQALPLADKIYQTVLENLQ